MQVKYKETSAKSADALAAFLAKLVALRSEIRREAKVVEADLLAAARIELTEHTAQQSIRDASGWHVLRREGEDVARCTVERWMRLLGIRGVVRGKKIVTTNPDTSQSYPHDKMNRLFMEYRRNKLWGCASWRHRCEPDGLRFHLCAHLVRDGRCGFRD